MVEGKGLRVVYRLPKALPEKRSRLGGGETTPAKGSGAIATGQEPIRALKAEL